MSVAAANRAKKHQSIDAGIRGGGGMRVEGTPGPGFVALGKEMAKKRAFEYTDDREGKLAELRSLFEDWPVVEVELKQLAGKEKNSRLGSASRSADVKKIAGSMKKVGQLQDACGFKGVDGKVHLVWGFGRAEAAELAGRKTLRTRVAPSPLSMDQVELLRGTENIFRIQLNGAELALQVTAAVNAVLMHHPGGESGAMAQVAEDFAVDAREVRDCRHVVERLTPANRERLAAGQLTLAQARELATIGGRDQDDIGADVARAAEGGKNWKGEMEGGRILSVEEIRGRIANRQHSLKIVPWKLDVVMKLPEGLASQGAGKTLMGEACGCQGCKHNTATDNTLWELGTKKKEEDGAGFCRMPACFEWHQRETAKAQEKSIEKLKSQVKAKKLDKDEAGGAAAVREVTPDFVKAEGVQRLARKELGLTKKPAAGAAGGGSGGGEKKKELTEKDKRQVALLKFREKYIEWAQAVDAKCDKHVAADGNRKAAAVLLLACRPAVPEFDLPNQYELQQGNQVAPPLEKPIKPPAARLLFLAGQVANGGLNAAQREELYAAIDYPGDDYYRGISFRSLGPVAIAAVCKVFGMELPSHPPVFETFLPKELQPNNGPQELAGWKVGQRVRDSSAREGVISRLAPPLRVWVTYKDQPEKEWTTLNLTDLEAKKVGPAKAMFDPGQLVYHKIVKQVGEVVELANSLTARVKLASGTLQEWRCTDCRTPKPAEALKFSDAASDSKMAAADIEDAEEGDA